MPKIRSNGIELYYELDPQGGAGRDLARLIPGAKLTEIPAAGHGFFWENVPEFNGAVVDFLRSVH